MNNIHATQIASISELKKNPSKLINEAKGNPVAILNHNTAAAYLVPAATFEKLIGYLDDCQLESIVRKRLSDSSDVIKMDIDEL